MSVKIITDSTSDISQIEAKQIGISVVPLSVIFAEKTYEDGIDITPDEFYGKLLSAKELPTTSQPSPEAFKKVFEEATKNGDEVVCILISSSISGTYASANIAKDLCEDKKIYIVDSRWTAMPLRMLVEYALKLSKEGKSGEEIAAAIEAQKEKIRLFAMVDTFEYLIKGGRMSKTAGAVGGLLNIKPIITLVDGSVKSIGKPRGISGVEKFMIDAIKRGGEIDNSHRVCFGYSVEVGETRALKEKIENEFDIKDADFFQLGPVIGTHVGPGTFVVTYMVK